MALLRIRQLPKTVEELREQQSPPPIPLPALGDTLDEQQPSSHLPPGEAATHALDLVKRLEQDPNDILAREKLARLFAESLRRVDDGLEQLNLLMAMEEQPENKRADWLSLMAAWHLRYHQDNASARKDLEQLLRECPRAPHTLAAKRRLELMDRQLSRSAGPAGAGGPAPG
jgi:hypothetical protein